MERCGWLEKTKIFFWILNFFLFFWIFINNNRNKITFKKNLVNPKLGYNKRHENSIFTLVDMVSPVLTPWNRFCVLWKMMVLTRNVTKTYFLPWSTWFDPYWPGWLGFDINDCFDRKWQFWPETSWKLIFYPGRHGLTRIDQVKSVFIERCGWFEKNIF